MKKVYLVWHCRVLSEEPLIEDEKLIGVYSTEKLAEEAIERNKTFKGFCDFPKGFYLNEYEIDEDAWSSGFITIEEALYETKEN